MEVLLPLLKFPRWLGSKGITESENGGRRVKTVI